MALLRKFAVHLKARDGRGVRKEISYDAIKATDVSAAVAAAIAASDIPLNEVYDLWAAERD